MTITKCISISREFEDLADKHRLSWSEAARIGMSILLADRGITEYDNKLNLYRKMQIFQKTAEDALQKLSEFQVKEENDL